MSNTTTYTSLRTAVALVLAPQGKKHKLPETRSPATASPEKSEAKGDQQKVVVFSEQR